MYNKQSQIKNEKYHKGFYENKEENIITHLLKIEDNNPNEEFKKTGCCYNAESFLHGICHIFAYALHQEFGYDILELKSNNCSAVHWCCTTQYKGVELYVDIRGMTSDIDELLTVFQPNMKTKPIIDKITDLTNYKDEWEEDAVKFANEIIKKYYNYYSIN